MSLSLRPVPLREANAFVREHHAHHGPARGCVFSVGCFNGSGLCGVAIVGRPVARNLQDGLTFELTRLCTNRTPHAASKLVAACTRAAFAIGVRRMVSYVLAHEAGISYRAAGWAPAIDRSDGGEWHRQSRARREPMADLLGLLPKHPEGPKVRWERNCFR